MKTEKEEEMEYEELVLSLPKVRTWIGSFLYEYQGVWCGRKFWPSILSFQAHFQALDSDMIVATFLKSGTTWLKALAYSLLNRSTSMATHNPLLSANPHHLVPFLEFGLHRTLAHHLPSPRLFATHLPYKLLPSSVNDSTCRIIYLCRNPLDQFISHYMFTQKVNILQEETETESLHVAEVEEALDMFCMGHQSMGPQWDHVLGYWKMSLERPDKVMFLKYEDLKEDTAGCVRKMGEFLGCAVSEEEENRGVIEDIVNMCSFDNLKGLEVNKSGVHESGIKHEYFFRKGEVGDWVNHLTPPMVERVKSVVEDKLRGSGLTFNFG